MTLHIKLITINAYIIMVVEIIQLVAKHEQT